MNTSKRMKFPPDVRKLGSMDELMKDKHWLNEALTSYLRYVGQQPDMFGPKCMAYLFMDDVRLEALVGCYPCEVMVALAGIAAPMLSTDYCYAMGLKGASDEAGYREGFNLQLMISIDVAAKWLVSTGYCADDDARKLLNELFWEYLSSLWCEED